MIVKKVREDRFITIVNEKSPKKNKSKKKKEYFNNSTYMKLNLSPDLFKLKFKLSLGQIAQDLLLVTI